MTLSVPGMTEGQWRALCEQYDDYMLEYTAEGELIIMPPTDPETSQRNLKLGGQLDRWADQDGRGIATESSGGFTLPNGARRAPDAAWISHERRRQRGVPEFVIELRSPSDRLNKLKAKMLEWIENGVELGWLIDPPNRTVTIYRPGRDPEERIGASKIHGEGPVAGFTLDLRPIWAITLP